MDTLIEILAGVGFAVVFIALARTRGRPRELLIYGVALGLAAAVYVAFALTAGNGHAFVVELLGVALFGSLGAVGIWLWPPMLAFGWIAHIAWDLLVSGSAETGYAPSWYPTLCIGTDLFLAGYIWGLLWSRRPTAS
ncbi:MAG TPA: hypothetical protein VJ692_14380 [Nitrospiraceae bacterium]|nr:hypothetical protein [Nitrospiraceae bacterium]